MIRIGFPKQKLTTTQTDPKKDAMAVKYPKPRILAVDLDSEFVRSMRTAGYNVSEGTFGSAYQIPRSNNYRVVDTNSVNLPHLNEQEILIVDLAGAEWGKDPGIETANNVAYVWQTCSRGRITPRELNMQNAHDQFEKVFGHAGICIVLTSPKSNVEYCLGKSNIFGILDVEGHFTLSNWGFLNSLEEADVNEESGEEIHIEDGPLSSFLKRYAADAKYTCTINYSDYESARWIPLALNKYGKPVAGVRFFPKSSQYILLLPRLPKLGEAIVDLLEDFVAVWRPDLFPHLEGTKWVHRQEYELPTVSQLALQIDDVQAQAKKKIEELQQQIATLRTENADWYTLLRGTGDELAHAIIRSFRTLGFMNVIDIDEEEKKKGNQNSLREDIQIHDAPPILVIDVKGINDCPSDEEATQSAKHATMRMREWKHTDVKPLTIVNHQRHLPPLDRNDVVYRQEIVGNAEQQELGLMTAWDLFRILRNKEHLRWPEDAVKAIFYRTGLIRPIPKHYEYLGTVAKAWSDKFGIVIDSNELRVGDRIAVEFPILFEEIDVVSIQVNDQAVPHAGANAPAGVLWDNAKPKVREGMRVYRIQKN